MIPLRLPPRVVLGGRVLRNSVTWEREVSHIFVHRRWLPPSAIFMDCIVVDINMIRGVCESLCEAYTHTSVIGS